MKNIMLATKQKGSCYYKGSKAFTHIYFTKSDLLFKKSGYHWFIDILALIMCAWKILND